MVPMRVFHLQVLVRLVMAELQAGVRRADQVVRIGGEEFLLLLPETSLHRAAKVAERIRQSVANKCLKVGSHEVRITVSMGLAERALGESRSELLARADEAMYEAKSGGRNRVVVAKTPTTPPPSSS